MFFRSTNRYGIRSCDWCEKIWFCGDKTWLWPQTEHTHMQTRWFTGHDLFNFCQVLHPKMSFCMVCGVVRWCCRVCQSKNWVMCTIWILWVLKLWNAKITNWKKLHETLLNSQCFFWIQKTAHIYYCKIYSCMKLEPQGAAQGTIRNMNDDLLLNLLEDRELSLLQNATAFVGFHFLGVFSICHFESTLPSLSASWVGSRQAWAVPCRICSMVFASRMPPPLQEKMFVPQWYFLFFIALLDFLQLRHLLIPWDRSRNHSVWPWHHMGVSKNRDTPNWMVYDGKPIKMDALGVPLFRKHPYFDPLEYVHHVFFVRFQHRRTAAEIHRCRKGQRTDIKPPATKHSAVSFDVFFFACSICIFDKDGLGKIRLCAKWWCQTLRNWCIRVSKHSEVVRSFFVRQVLKREIVYDSQTLPIPRVFISDISHKVLGVLGMLRSMRRFVVWLAWHLAFSWWFETAGMPWKFNSVHVIFLRENVLHPADMLKQHAFFKCDQVKRSDITPEQFFKAWPPWPFREIHPLFLLETST